MKVDSDVALPKPVSVHPAVDHRRLSAFLTFATFQPTSELMSSELPPFY